MLDGESFDGLLFCQGWRVVVQVGGLGLLLHLHYLHALALVLTVVHGRLLELLLADTQLGEDLIELVLNKHLLFLDHLADNLLIELFISSLQSLSTLRNELLSLFGEV